MALSNSFMFFAGRGASNQYDILQKHRINLSDDEMSQFTEQFKVSVYGHNINAAMVNKFKTIQ